MELLKVPLQIKMPHQKEPRLIQSRIRTYELLPLFRYVAQGGEDLDRAEALLNFGSQESQTKEAEGSKQLALNKAAPTR